MKTTLDLRDDLLIAAKKCAAGERRTLTSIVEEALRNVLERRTARRRGKKIAWVTSPGALPADLDLSNREHLQEWLRGHRR